MIHQLKEQIVKNKLSFIALLAATILYSYQSNNWFSWSNKDKNEHFNILTDGSGYYAYLPATFIYQDYRFTFLDQISKKYNTVLLMNGTNQSAGKDQLVNKYFIGTSILISPFFLLNHAANKVLNKTADGYSKSYRLMVSASALFYYLLGMIALISLFNLFKISDGVIAISILGLTFGTSLHFYTVYYPSFSHVFSFFAVTSFLLLAKLFSLHPSKRKLFLLALSLGLIFLLRPTNVVVLLFLPFMFRSWKHFASSINHFFKYKKTILLVALIIFVSICSLQLLNVFLQTGKISADTYQGETFEFLFHPKIFEVLFSYKKGLFVYAPVLFLLIPGFIYLGFKQRYLFWGSLLTLGLILYVTSSWWCWWYGGGLGMRPLVDFSALLMLPVVILIQALTGILKVVALSYVLLSSFVYRTYQIQFNTDILHYENMTAKTFWQCFLKTDFRYAWFVFFQDDQLPDKKPALKSSFFYNNSNKAWEQIKSKNQLDFGDATRDLDIRYTAIANPDFRQLYITLSANYWIEKSETNPGFILKYYKKGIEVFNRNFHIGSRIPDLKQLTPVTCTIKSSLQESAYDSLQIFYTRNVHPSALKDLSVKFLYFN